jgi:hypothetical protein
MEAPAAAAGAGAGLEGAAAAAGAGAGGEGEEGQEGKATTCQGEPLVEEPEDAAAEEEGAKERVWVLKWCDFGISFVAKDMPGGVCKQVRGVGGGWGGGGGGMILHVYLLYVGVLSLIPSSNACFGCNAPVPLSTMLFLWHSHACHAHSFPCVLPFRLQYTLSPTSHCPLHLPIPLPPNPPPAHASGHGDPRLPWPRGVGARLEHGVGCVRLWHHHVAAADRAQAHRLRP